jgi:hypothetical protein
LSAADDDFETTSNGFVVDGRRRKMSPKNRATGTGDDAGGCARPPN